MDFSFKFNCSIRVFPLLFVPWPYELLLFWPARKNFLFSEDTCFEGKTFFIGHANDLAEKPQTNQGQTSGREHTGSSKQDSHWHLNAALNCNGQMPKSFQRALTSSREIPYPITNQIFTTVSLEVKRSWISDKALWKVIYILNNTWCMQ